MDDECTDVARSFGATCRCLHTVSRSYIFRERRLRLEDNHIHIDWEYFDTLQEEEKIGYHDGLVEQARSNFIQYAELLRTSADVRRSIRRLNVESSWNSKSLQYSSFFNDEDKSGMFYASIHKAEYDTLPTLTSLCCLSMHGWIVTWELLEKLQTLTHLHTLELKACVLDAPPTGTSV
ncbi:hypothetical protein QCA50_005573 [Cerrena zonata]|uniref:Uncharacterized protein n=1 Tax=Cerrena zonata TaxID=2478898 RepID=A0AAW0GMS7_9APHY